MEVLLDADVDHGRYLFTIQDLQTMVSKDIKIVQLSTYNIESNINIEHFASLLKEMRGILTLECSWLGV